MRKQLDPRIPALISNAVAANHRSFFVIVGDHGRDQVVNLHFLLSQVRVSARPNVLWCYKKELGFTSHRKKREAKIKRDVKRGIRDVDEQSPFELFIAVTDIRYNYYKESHKVLGQTFGCLVLQDYEAVTPNLLARTIETVEGGGIVILLLKTMNSLKQLYSMSMDVHARYRTEAHTDVQPRFNERFILSLGSCATCLVLDDELNVLPLSAGKDISADPAPALAAGTARQTAELTSLKNSLADTPVVGPLAKLCATTDQLRGLLTFVQNGITAKTLSSTISLTAGRGRGKSAALGLTIAAAVAHDYSNIFVTSPTPENLKTLFEFVGKGLNAMGYEETLDYEVVRTGNEDWGRAVVRINIFKGHRQTIQYIQPQDAHVLGQAELLIIDEAAAIPLPLVRKLLGPYLVFMASTINGYEGTGRSLSIKLIQQLREQTRPTLSAHANNGAVGAAGKQAAATGKLGTGMARTLTEIKLDQPIRYGAHDPVEKWLNALLCLDASTLPKSVSGCPHPATCELFYVNRDTLFSYHPASEVFLQRMMALYVASHYKNSPNDLQLMSDAPAHHLFVLLPPLKDDESTLPDPLVVIQVALEGNISRANILSQLSKGKGGGGDLIPWLVSQQFQDDDFAMLSGARVVRIATHPDYARMGYGARALQALNSFYAGELSNLEEMPEEDEGESFAAASRVDKDATLQSDEVTIRDPKRMPPLLQRLSERKPEQLDYLGVSYGLTKDLLRFWKRAGYVPLYIRQTTNELTGEHTCVMLRSLTSQIAKSDSWLSAFSQDFRRRFLSLLSYNFRAFDAALALSVIEGANAGEGAAQSNSVVAASELNNMLTPFDIKRMESYANNMLDYHVVLDLLPTVASLYFTRRLGPEVTLAAAQQAILLALGLQRKSIEDVESELRIPVSQGLALFVKVMRKIARSLRDIQRADLEKDVPAEEPQVLRNVDQDGQGTSDWRPMATTVQEDLAEVVDEETRRARAMQRELIDSMDLTQYAIDEKADFSEAQGRVAALAAGGTNGQAGASSVVSVKSIATAEPAAPAVKRKASGHENGSRESKKGKGSKHKSSSKA